MSKVVLMVEAVEPASEADSPTRVPCFHCGTLCRAAAFRREEKSFCCQGCLTVFELLSENGLTEFYELSQAAGVRINAAAKLDQFEFLDEPGVRERLVDFSNARLTRVTFQLPAIHCIACVWLLENLYRLKPGLGQSQVNFPRKELSLAFDPAQVRLSEVVVLLSSLGYEPELKLAALEAKPRNRRAGRLWIQTGLAGFAFGNIMLFSISAYLGLDAFSGPGFQRMVGGISFALALPVVVYSAQDYWRAAWRSVRQRLLNIDVPIALGVAAIFLQSSFEVFTGRGAGYFDSLCGLIFFLLCGRLFQQKTYDRLAFDRDYKSFFPLSVTRKERRSPVQLDVDGAAQRSGPETGASAEERISLAQLQVGDRLLIRNGELIPADAKLVSGPALIDYSFVTGESEPVEKKPEDYLYAGGRQMGGVIEVETVKAVSQSYLTSLWNQESFRKPGGETLDTLTNKYSQWFTKFVIGIAVGAAMFWAFVNPAISLKAFTSVLIVACPCALALAAPFALGTAQRALARRNVFLKNSYVLETLARVDTVVFDKTGTLTAAGAGNVTWIGATRLSLAPGFSPVSADAGSDEPFQRLPGQASEKTVETVSDSPRAGFTRLKPGANESNQGLPLSEAEECWLYSMARHSTHPLPVRIGEAIARDHYPEPVRSFRETPGCGMEGSVEGHAIWMGSAVWLASRGVQVAAFTPPPGSSNDAELEKSNPGYSSASKRPESHVPSGSVVHVAMDGKYRGRFELTTAVRPQTERLVAGLAGRHAIALLSGDHDRERRRFHALFGARAELRFNQSPLDKLNFVKQRREAGQTVMMVGDGLNDAGALKLSDVGVAVVEQVSAFSPASDVIIASGMVTRLADVLRYARQSVRVVQAAIVISALYNVFGVAIAASGRLAPVVCALLMPLSSVSVVAFATTVAAWRGRRVLGRMEAA